MRLPAQTMHSPSTAKFALSVPYGGIALTCRLTGSYKLHRQIPLLMPALAVQKEARS